MKTTNCQLATDSTFAVVAALGAGWTYEPKLDGHRLLVSREGCTTRTGRTVTYAAIQAACPDGALLDCELVTKHGRSTASRVQSRRNRPDELRAVAFDVLRVGGVDVTGLPQLARRAILVALDLDAFVIQTVESYDDPTLAMQSSEEGIIAKRSEAAYHLGRVSTWLKAKWAYHREGSCVDWLHDEIDWSAVEDGKATVTRSTMSIYR
jgi:bifunctional non-homologous end joining protein LigD